LNETGALLAYHDRSDGGLITTLIEMAFAGHCGVDVDVAALGNQHAAALFNEELGAVIQVRNTDLGNVQAVLQQHGVGAVTQVIGKATKAQHVRIKAGGTSLLDESTMVLKKIWSKVSYEMQALRDNPRGAEEEYASKCDAANPGIKPVLTFNPAEDIAAPFIAKGAKPKVAVLREQGVNGQLEMAAAFMRAGFRSIDVHMSDLLAGRVSLKDFAGVVACGGFSYGDVLGAGGGWAKSVLFHGRTRDEFSAFFARPDSFALGVCNGCQMMSQLKDMIPGAEHFPRFVRNASEQFEGRFVQMELQKSPSLFFADMHGSRIPVAVAHGEGYAETATAADAEALSKSGLVAARWVDNYGKTATANPNGSPHGICAVTSRDGRVTILMPHPERVFRTVQNSWHPAEWGEDGPWLRMFRNARRYVG
jgi:phosphoribosylformylglycinamidine synthase